MARSLTVQHEENVTTSPLMWGFLAFAVLWMVAGSLVAASSVADAAMPDPITGE